MSSIASPFLFSNLEGPFQSLSPNIETLETGTPLSNKAVTKGSSICKSHPEAVTEASAREKTLEGKSRSIIGQEEIEDFQHDNKNVLQNNLSRNYTKTDLFDTQNTESNPQEPNYKTITDGAKKVLGPFQHIDDEIANRPTNCSSPQTAAQDKNEMFRMDEDRNLVKTYFHDMLKYINKNDATLADDEDGDLAFFIKQMPDEEMRITFSQWILRKRNELKNNFKNDVNRKLDRLRKEFDRIIEMIDLIDDENQLINLAENLDVTLENAKD